MKTVEIQGGTYKVERVDGSLRVVGLPRGVYVYKSAAGEPWRGEHVRVNACSHAEDPEQAYTRLREILRVDVRVIKESVLEMDRIWEEL